MTQEREKLARVYFRRDGKQVIVATIHHTPGLLHEAEGPLSLTTWNEEELGESIKTALEQSSTLTKVMPGARPFYWPALKASGEPSERSFEAGFIQIDVGEFASTFILIDGFAFSKELRLRMEVPSKAPTTELARKVTRIFEICRDRKF
jgi:hypothetical protein